MLLGLLTSFLAGLAAIFVLLRVVEKISFRPFAVYLVGLALVLVWVG
jgi:undecaprenyl pyrophosphate phosphatase UppP